MLLSDDSLSESDSDPDELLAELSSELEDCLDSVFFLAEVTCFVLLWFSLDTSAFLALGFGGGVPLGDLVFRPRSLTGDFDLTALL